MTAETLRWYGLDVPVLRDRSDQIVCAGSRVRFTVTDVEMENDPTDVIAFVVELNSETGELFVSEPGNMGAEGWIPACEVERV